MDNKLRIIGVVLVFCTLLTSTVPVSAQTRLGALILNTGENNLTSAVIDTVNGFAYFGTLTSPGRVVKVRLSDFTRVDALTLNTGEDRLLSAVIDAANGFAYFGTDTWPGRVVKVRLVDLERVDALPLNTGEAYLSSAVIETFPGFAYFGTDTAPGKVVKVRLSDFSWFDAVTLNTGEDCLRSAVIDTLPCFSFFGTDTAPGKVVKVRLADLTRVKALTLKTGEDQPFSAVIDTGRGFAYFGTWTWPGRVVKVRLYDFTRVGALTLEVGEGYFKSAVIDAAGDVAYFGTETWPGSVVMVWTALGLSGAGSGVVDAAAWKVYYIYPATAATGGVRDPQVIYALATDWSATGLILGMSTNAQKIGLDSDGVWVSTEDGWPRSDVIGAGKTIVVVSGPVVHAAVHYYEVHGTGADKAPLYFAYDDNNFYFRRSSDNSILASMLRTKAGMGTDMFLLELFPDADGRIVFILYGFTYLGTMAASTYFKFVIYPILGKYPQGYYIFLWTDAASGESDNGIPDLGDTYLLLTSGT